MSATRQGRTEGSLCSPVHPFAAFELFTSCMYYLLMKGNFQVWGTYKKTQAARPLNRMIHLRKILRTKV